MVHGALDPIPYAETRQLLTDRVQAFEFALIDGAGHFPWYEAPDQVRAVIGKFCGV